MARDIQGGPGESPGDRGDGDHVPDEIPAAGHYTFREDEGNLARWKGWWDVANKEHLVSFVAITIVTITLMSLLAYSTVLGSKARTTSASSRPRATP